MCKKLSDVIWRRKKERQSYLHYLHYLSDNSVLKSEEGENSNRLYKIHPCTINIHNPDAPSQGEEHKDKRKW